MPYNRGDVLLVLYPESNLRTAKRRPALVVQADNLQTGLPQLILAMISSNLARARVTQAACSCRPRHRKAGTWEYVPTQL